MPTAETARDEPISRLQNKLSCLNSLPVYLLYCSLPRIKAFSNCLILPVSDHLVQHSYSLPLLFSMLHPRIKRPRQRPHPPLPPAPRQEHAGAPATHYTLPPRHHTHVKLSINHRAQRTRSLRSRFFHFIHVFRPLQKGAPLQPSPHSSVHYLHLLYVALVLLHSTPPRVHSLD